MRINLDIPLSIEEVQHAISSNIKSNISTKKNVTAICTNSKECNEGDLFIAISGENGTGEDYVKDALSKHALALSVSCQEGVITVNDTASALMEIAKYYKSKLKLRNTVSVTGSVGKSTTVKFISKIIGAKYKIHSPIGNFNNHIGVPLTILGAPKDTEFLITELGMNHEKEISALSRCASPDIGLITCIGTSHIGNLGSRENIAKAKAEILDGMSGGPLLIPYNESLLSKLPNSMTVAHNSSLSDFRLYIEPSGHISFSSSYGEIDNFTFFDSREHILTDLAFAISVSQIIGISKDEIKRGISAITPADIRQRFIHLNRFTIFDDSYNASLESIAADLKYLSGLNQPTGVFIGDVLELGDMSESIHESIGKAIAEAGVTHLYLYGQYAKSVEKGAVGHGFNRNNIYLNSDFPSPDISIKQIREHSVDGEVILFKASHKLRFDKIADLVAKEEKNNDKVR